MKKMLLALAIVALGSSCSASDRETQITIGLSSETEVPKELDSFTILVFGERDNDLRFKQDYFPTNGRDFPTTLGVIPANDDSVDGALRIELEGHQGSSTFLRRVAVMSYRKGKNVLLSMPLRMACFQFRGCGANETCAGGQCIPSKIDAEKLPAFEAGAFFPKPGACFDEEQCLGGSKVVAVNQDCTFAIPAGTAVGQGNVSIQWAAAPERLLALEHGDAQEGWVRVSESEGKLSQGACDSHFRKLGPDGQPLVADWAKQVYFSTTCASKNASVAACFSQVTLHSGIGARFPKP